MNCIETKKNIEALIDGELAGALKEPVERHLLVCRDCNFNSRRQFLIEQIRQRIASRFVFRSVEIFKFIKPDIPVVLAPQMIHDQIAGNGA